PRRAVQSRVRLARHRHVRGAHPGRQLRRGGRVASGAQDRLPGRGRLPHGLHRRGPGGPAGRRPEERPRHLPATTAGEPPGGGLMPTKIPFNKPFIAGKELYYVAQAVTFGNLGGDGHYTQACCRALEERFGIPKVLLVPSCTAALEMAAILFDLKPGDEVILPSFTFVSTANAVVRLGARPVFVDVRPGTPNLDDALIEEALPV